MKNSYIYILLFCIFCNFFSNDLLLFLSWGGYDKYILFGFVPEAYFREASVEMFAVFIVLVIISIYVKKPRPEFQKNRIKTYRSKYKPKSIFTFLVWCFYIFVVVFLVFKTNWSFNVENRGVAQFELANRQSFIQGIAYYFYLPFLLYLYIIGFFKKKNYIFFFLAIIIYLINGVAEGGRNAVVSFSIIGLLTLIYLHSVTKRSVVFLCVFSFLALIFSANDRFNSNDSFLLNNAVKILQCNSTSEFLGVVKYSISTGVDLGPDVFFMHFVSIFVPSYVYVNFFDVISYTRSTFVYNTLYNPNPDGGLGFMMLADYYWSFHYFGYVLFIATYYFVLRVFRKNIYSHNPVLVVIAIIIVFLFCSQRNDFGAFLKPLVYTYIFLSILEYFRKVAIVKYSRQ